MLFVVGVAIWWCMWLLLRLMLLCRLLVIVVGCGSCCRLVLYAFADDVAVAVFVDCCVWLVLLLVGTGSAYVSLLLACVGVVVV